MTKDRFYRIIKEIKSGRVENSKDRKDVLKKAYEYADREDLLRYFLTFRGKEAFINNEEIFERFIEENLGCKFEEYKEFDSKKELALVYKDTKAKNLHTGNITIIHRKRNNLPQIFYDDCEPQISGRVVVIENYESFLRLNFDLFEEEDFIYLGGFSNKKTAEFLKDKDILFFGDFDFYGMMIFDSIKCKNKEFFAPENLEELFIKYPNQKLYLKQRFIEERVKKVDILYELIKKHSAIVEQEVLNK
ncbi:MAG: Wadjet anti-phage system protein JetD domain-containing protein, partial [Nautiliaceae bacterium]